MEELLATGCLPATVGTHEALLMLTHEPYTPVVCRAGASKNLVLLLCSRLCSQQCCLCCTPCSVCTLPPRRHATHNRVPCLTPADAGHADITKFEWLLNIHRDSYASYIGHHNMLSYFAVAQNESIGRVKYEFLQKMLLPCGLPPAEKEEE